MGLKDKEVKQLAYSLYYEWMCYQTLVATMRNSSYKNNVIYLPDDSSITNDYKSLLKIFKSTYHLVDPALVAT